MAATDFPCTSFPTHSVPDITRHDSVLAICTVPQAYCETEALAFYAADFAAFKHLFSARCPVEQQTWLSACDPRHLPLLRHGTRDVKGAFDDQVMIEKDQSQLIKEFTHRIKKMANEIRFRAKLTIIVCGPTSLSQDILKDLPCPLSVEDRADFLYIEDLREIIGHGVDSMLVTPNMHVGGWIVNPSLTRAVLPRPSAQEKEYAIRRAVRNTAPLFIDSSFATLMKQSSPMRLQPDRGNGRSMMPAWPTKDQRNSHIKFYGTVHEASFGSLLAAPRMHAFNFTVDLDNWVPLCGPRFGPHLVEHADRWRKLPMHREPTVSRCPFPFYCFGSSQESQLLHLKTLAFMLHEDWTRDESDRGHAELQITLDTAFGLSDVAESMTEEQIEHAYIQFAHISMYRQALMNLVDAIVLFCGLTPLPSRCSRWQTACETRAFGFEHDDPDLRKSVLPDIRALLPIMPGQTPRLVNPITYGVRDDDFVRPAQYLWRIFAVRAASESNIMTCIQTYLQTCENVVNSFRERAPDGLLSSPWVAGAGYALVRCLDKGPNSDRLRAGPLTTLATGVAHMPSEMIMMRADRKSMPHHGWRGSSRRAGGPSNAASNSDKYARRLQAARRTNLRPQRAFSGSWRTARNVLADAQGVLHKGPKTALEETPSNPTAGVDDTPKTDESTVEENLIYFSDDEMPEVGHESQGNPGGQEEDQEIDLLY